MVFTAIDSPLFLNIFTSCFFFLSTWDPDNFLKRKRPSSLLSPMFSIVMATFSLLSKYVPTNSHTSIPS